MSEENKCHFDDKPCDRETPAPLDFMTGVCKVCILYKILDQLELIRVTAKPF